MRQSSTLAAGGAHTDWRLDIQGIRAIAVLLVVAFHAGLPIPGGFVGVDVFFVISGFVITSMLQREWIRDGSINFSRFFLRRLKRLTPALALVVGVTTATSVLVLSPFGPQEVAAQTAIGALVFGANLVIAFNTGGYFDAPAETNPLLNTWSLSVEDQFYLVFPAVLAFGWMLAKRSGRASAPMVLGAVVAAGSFALAVKGPELLDLIGFDGPYLRWGQALVGFYSPLTRAWEFALGAILALVLASRTLRLGQGLATLFGGLGLAILLASLWLITPSTPFPGVWTAFPVTGSLLLLVAGVCPENPFTRVLQTRIMSGVGDRSYSIYLWHWPLIVFAVILWPHWPLASVVAAVVSLLPALASYRWLEEPVRALPLNGATRGRVAKVLAWTYLPAFTMSLLLWVGAAHGFGMTSIQDQQVAVNRLPLGHMAGCDSVGASDGQPLVKCTWNSGAPGRPVYLVGDSNADQFSDGLVSAATRAGRSIRVQTTTACPFVDLRVRTDRSEVENNRCAAYVETTLAQLEKADPGLVVVANSDHYWLDDAWSVEVAGSEVSTDANIKSAALAGAMVDTVRELENAGHQVLLIQTIPQWIHGERWNPSSCTTLQVALSRCEASATVAELDEFQGATRSVLDRVALETGSTTFDPWDHLCPGGICSTRSREFVRYRDSSHISGTQSDAFAPEFYAVLKES